MNRPMRTTPLSLRLFWAQVLALQLAGVAAGLWFAASAGGRLHAFALAFQCLCVVPMVGLVLQRRIFRHRFWAGFFGVAVGGTLFGLLMLAGGLATPDPTRGGVPGLAVLSGFLHVLALFAVFAYVFGSPAIWSEAADLALADSDMDGTR